MSTRTSTLSVNRAARPSVRVFLGLLLIGALHLQAALTDQVVGEVRPGSGNDNNGGFFLPGASGTDYSQQNSPQYALTGVTSSGAGNTVLFASAASDMVGNGARVVSGTNFNTGTFLVTSVSVGVSITFGTNGAGQSISSGVGASGVINIGGATATLQVLLDALTNSTSAHIWIKNTGTLTITSSNTPASPSPGHLISGYGTTRGDGVRSSITTSTNSVHGFVSNGQVFGLENIDLSSTAGTPGDGVRATAANSTLVLLRNVKVSGFNVCANGNNAGSIFIFNTIALIDSEVTGCTSHAIQTQGYTFVYGSYLHGNSGDGINLVTGALNVVVQNSILASSVNGIAYVSGGMGSGSQVFVSNSAFYNLSGNGITGPGGSSASLINGNALNVVNTIFSTITGTALNAGPALLQMVSGSNNKFYNNGTNFGNAYTSSVGGTLTADPFTNAAGGNFALNNTAGGGAACRATGFPGVLAAGGTGFIDIGPLQHQDAGGGGQVGYPILAAQRRIQ